MRRRLVTDPDQRQQLVEAAERAEAELETALVDLKHAVARPLALGSLLRDAVSEHPVQWLVAGLVVGMWLGRRSR